MPSTHHCRVVARLRRGALRVYSFLYRFNPFKALEPLLDASDGQPLAQPEPGPTEVAPASSTPGSGEEPTLAAGTQARSRE